MENITDLDYSHAKWVCEKLFKVVKLILQKKLSSKSTALLRLMNEKGIKGVICHSINRCAKADNKYMKDYDKIKESLYSKYWDVNNLYSWAMSQKLPVSGFT